VAGTDRFGRVTNLTFNHPVDAQTNDLVHRYQYGYDSNGNRLFARIEQNGQVNERSYAYGYDALNRLTVAERGALQGLARHFAADAEGVYWGLDVVGNWEEPSGALVRYTGIDNAFGYDVGVDDEQSVQNRGHDALNRLSGWSEYTGEGTTIEDLDVTSASYGYDPAGNVTSAIEYDDAGNVVGERHYVWDAWNRLVRVEEGAARDVKATYKYDALGRRIQKRVFSPAALATEGNGAFFYYDGHRVVEHHETGLWYETVCDPPPPDPDPGTNKLRAEAGGSDGAEGSRDQGIEGRREVCSGGQAGLRLCDVRLSTFGREGEAFGDRSAGSEGLYPAG